MTKLKIALIIFSLSISAGLAIGESVNVKYRGTVDLTDFVCETTAGSRFIRRVCYDKRNEYMVISLNGTWYHYCEIPERVVAALISAGSMGSYYNSGIKGQYDCRVHRVPNN